MHHPFYKKALSPSQEENRAIPFATANLEDTGLVIRPDPITRGAITGEDGASYSARLGGVGPLPLTCRPLVFLTPLAAASRLRGL